MFRDLCQSLPAIVRRLQQSSALRAHDSDQNIDQRHERRTEQTCPHRISRNFSGLLHAQIPDHFHHNDAERQPRQRIHRVISLQKPREKRSVRVSSRRSRLPDVSHGRQKRPHYQDSEKAEEERIQHFPDPCQDLSRSEGKEQNRSEEEQGEDRQPQALSCSRKDPLYPHCIGNRGTSGNGKKRSDGQVQRTGKEKSVPLSHSAPQLQKPVFTADPQSRNGKKRQPDSCDQESGCRLPHVRSGKLSHGRGEYEIPRPEKHAEKHARYCYYFSEIQLFHFNFPPDIHIWTALPLKSGSSLTLCSCHGYRKSAIPKNSPYP